MATIRYIIKGKKEISTIYLRLRDGREIDITCSTKYTINPKYWSFKKGEPKSSSKYQDKINLTKWLRELKEEVLEYLNLDKGKKVQINNSWLKHRIALYKNPDLDKEDNLLISAFENYKNKLIKKTNPKTNKKISLSTIKNYNTTIQRIRKYEKFKEICFTILDIDLEFREEYIEFAQETLGLSINSIGGDIKKIKTVCFHIKDNGGLINQQVESTNFKAFSEPSDFVTLSEGELELIKNYKGKNYLENARDWLIIGCWTGCRVNDLMSITKNNIEKGKKGNRYIKIKQSKTGKIVHIPIHPDVNKILNDRNEFPNPISAQRFNEWIKLVCKEVGIKEKIKGSRQNPMTHKKETEIFEKWQLIRSHTCRRTFATIHYEKDVPNKIIMAVTGHTSEKTFLKYIGKKENSHLSDFEILWNKDNKSKKV